MRRQNNGAESFLHREFEDVCFHSLGLIDQNREYLQMHLVQSEDLPTRQALSDIQVESARVERAVMNAVTLCRLETEEPEELQPFDLCALLERAGQMAENVERALEVKLTVDADGMERCAVMAVPNEAEQLLLHLISNALCACNAGGNVQVSLKQQKTGAVLCVEDDGCGLPEENPVENNRHFMGGTKMGLSICKLICRRAGWKLTLANRPGGGACAQVEIPLASCEDIPQGAALHSGEESEILAARFASKAAREVLLLRKY